MHTKSDEVWTVYKPEENDVFYLNPICFSGDTDKIRAGDYLQIDGQHSFRKLSEETHTNQIAKCLEHIKEFYTLKDVLSVLYKTIFRKIKNETIKVQWIAGNNFESIEESNYDQYL